MKVSLRKFLEIVGDNFVATYVASLYIEEWDEIFKEWTAKKKIELIHSVRELEPYLDWEITAVNQDFNYGEICEQRFYIKKI